MANVEIYSGDYCPYCVRAKSLLKNKGVAFTEYDVQRDLACQAAMVERSGGARSIPQIFINGKHIGGCDDLYALDLRGELDPMLAG